MGHEMEPVQSMTEEIILFEKLSVATERNLTEEQKNVIVLKSQKVFSLKETAEVIGKNVGAVIAFQNRGIHNLHQAMGRLDEEL